MAIVPRDPFQGIEKWFEDEWPEILSGGKGRMMELLAKTPRINVYEEGDSIIAEADLPGLDPKNINVEVQDNVLYIEGKSEEKTEEKEKDFYHQEISSRYYQRSVSLPEEVQGEKAEADYKDGVLRVAIPKLNPGKEKKKGVKVNVRGVSEKGNI